MSKMYSNQDYQKCFPAEPKSVHQTMLHTLETLDERAAKKRGPSFRKFRKWAAAAAALVAVTGITVTAAGKFPWNRKLVEFFGSPSQEVQDELGENGFFSMQGNSVTDGGITVTVLQTVQDRQSVTALLQVTAEDSELEDKLETGEFEYAWVYEEPGIQLLNHPAVQTVGFRYDGKKQMVRTEQGLAAYMTYEFHWTLTEEVNFDNLLLCFKNFQYANGASNIVKGNWDIPIALNTDQTAALTKIYEPNQEIVTEGGSILITKLALTPLSIEMSGQADKTADTDIFCCSPYDERAIYALEDLNGNIIDINGWCTDSSIAWRDDPFKTYHAVIKPEEILDVANVRALIFRNGTEEIRIELQ